MNNNTSPNAQANPVVTAEAVLATLSDTPESYRDTLKILYVAASRKFPALKQEQVETLADHYLELDDLLYHAECFQEQHQTV